MPPTWIAAPDETYRFGTIPPISHRFDPLLCCPGGEIRLEVGNIAWGFAHLSTEERRARTGGQDIVRYVYGITSSYHEIWVQSGRGSLLLKQLQGGQRAAVVSLTLRDGYYSVLTAFPTPRALNHRRRREVRIWSREA
ncbi:hypothetical protein [Methylobacterium oryzihabitans]|uniref:Uncharacterized protein n=1 Tax=Methylobacterium oryzihabitans TaxID=2499852 RepID=A0A437P0M9_9HYPH|nr:hypothetical protein [Methylobacterium oryzihabitans]RVU15802.1 hypothetical protein EOE48_18575 [Methylobacterium oryzihabitans]